MERKLDNEAIGRRIRAQRMRKTISQTDLARLIGVSQTHMSNMEHGKVGMTLEVLVKLTEILDCSLEDIVFATKVPEKDNKETIALPDCTLSELLQALVLLRSMR